MDENEFWAIVETLGWGTKTTDYDVVKTNLMKQLPRKTARDLRTVFRYLSENLYREITSYEKHHNVSAGLGDDSFGDLIAHIIGLGRSEYVAVMYDPSLAIGRAKKHDFTESFSYCLPYDSDYDNPDPPKSEVGPMKLWRVLIREVHVSHRLVEACSIQEAMEKAGDGEETYMEYSHTLPKNTWTAEVEPDPTPPPGSRLTAVEPDVGHLTPFGKFGFKKKGG